MSLKYLPRSTTVMFLISMAALSTGAVAQLPVSATTGGDLCAPVNVAKANRTIQNLRGSIVNISTDEEIAVSCPLATYFPSTNVDVVAIVQNSAEVEQTAKCVLREADPVNFVLSTTRQNVTIPAGFSAGFVFSGVQLADNVNRLNLTCLLPPATSLGALLTDSL